MKTAVDGIGSGKARQVNARFAAMASHYLFETDFCNPASGWEKGQVEKNADSVSVSVHYHIPTGFLVYILAPKSPYFRVVQDHDGKQLFSVNATNQCQPSQNRKNR
jgi:transposase